MVRRTLTEDQEIILEYIAGEIINQGISPTYSEVSQFTGFTQSKVQRTVEKCVKLKMLKRKPLVMSGLKLGKEYAND